MAELMMADNDDYQRRKERRIINQSISYVFYYTVLLTYEGANLVQSSNRHMMHNSSVELHELLEGWGLNDNPCCMPLR
jgi:hypothetical protein